MRYVSTMTEKAGAENVSVDGSLDKNWKCQRKKDNDRCVDSPGAHKIKIFTTSSLKSSRTRTMGGEDLEANVPPVDGTISLEEEEEEESREEPLNNDWVITKISRVQHETPSHQTAQGSPTADGAISIDDRDKSTMTSDTGSTAFTNGSDEEEGVAEASTNEEVEENREFESLDVDNSQQCRKIEIFDPNDPVPEYAPSPERVDLKDSIVLEQRVLSSCSKDSVYTAFTSTVAADNTSKETFAVDSSMTSDGEESKTEKPPFKHRHAIFCLLILALVLGATAFIFFGTGLASKLREKDSLRGAQDTEAPVSSSNSAPSPAPTTDSLFGIISPFSGDALEDPDSPQYQAFQWMNEDVVSNDPDTHPARIQQRYALITLYTALLGNIPSFAYTTGNECEWPSIQCGTDPSNIRTWQVTEIRMSRQSLSGGIPSEINLLSSSLIYLDLAENKISGDIPDELYGLLNLKYLYLHDNEITGSLSERIAKLLHLKDLYLGNNRFSGTIPSLGIRPLRKLILHKNQFEGTIPNMTLMNATYIDLSWNKLNGTLPSAEDFHSLKQLYLDNNKLTGSIPESYGLIGNGSLVTLDLSHNTLSGGVPTAWVDTSDTDATSSINTIKVQNNNLTDAIDNNICKLAVSNRGSLVEFEADCDICECNEFCGHCLGN